MYDMINNFSYLSGYIDGDGHFQVGTEYQRSRDILVISYSIQISSVCPEIMPYFTETFGGYFSQKPERPKRKTLYIWTAKTKKALKISLQIERFLIDKKRICNLFIQLAQLIRPNAGVKIRKETIQKRINIINLIKEDRHMTNFVTKENIDSLKNITEFIQPDEANLAYFAGLIDAEGSFTIKHWQPKNKKNRDYVISLQIGNTKFPIFPWIVQRFGGTVHFYQPTARRTRAIATWHLMSHALSIILPKIYPFLKVKKERCKKLMEFYETNIPNGGNRRSEEFKIRSAEAQAKRAKLIEELHKLNAKGKHE